MATSFRSVARSCPACLANRPSTPLVAAPPTARFVAQRHQRRHSSSKPPTPPNQGSPSIPDGSDGPVKGVSSRTRAPTEKRAGTESRLSKRKPKDKAFAEELTQDDLVLKLPSVPDTRYLQPKDVHLASLFSTHRPISITSPIPTSVKEDAFASIFNTRTKQNKNGPNDVIYTLSSAVKVLDSVIQQHQAGGTPQQQGPDRIAHMRSAISQKTHGDAQQQSQPQVQYFTDLKQAIDEVAKQFRPFNPPPAPVPTSDQNREAGEMQQEGRTGPPTETSEQNGDDFHQDIIIVKQNEDGTMQPEFFTAHSTADYYEIETPVHIEDFPRRREISSPSHPSSASDRHAPSATPARSFVPRRRMTGTEIRQAISVKRQRKLKMKKHKYKKLMRKTRNLRRKLGQL